MGMKHIGESIKARRQSLNLTQAQLAEKMGLDVAQISNISSIENGKITNLTLERITAFAKALDCHPSDLLLDISFKSEQPA